MRVLHSSLYAAALLACLALIPVARATLRDPRRATWLTVFLVLQALGFVFEWLMLHPSTPAKSLWLGLLMSLAFFLAPCLWMCARELTGNGLSSWRQVSPWHFAVIGAGVVLVLPLLASTHAGKDFFRAGEFSPPWHEALIHEGMLTAIVLFGLQGGYYLRECARLLARHTKQSKALFSDIDDQSLNTLRALILVLAMHCVVGVGRGVYGLLLGREAGPNAIFALCEVAVLAWAVFTLPRARTGLDPDERELAEPTVQDKYSRSALDEAVRARIQRKLAEALEVRRLHRDGRLTLRGLCADLRENPHYVSQVINQDLGRSFYDLVNQHRVQDAMTLLAAQPAMPVSEAATEVGFNSRSTFNAAFRQQAGLSPSAWRRKHASAPTGADLPSGT